MTRSEAIDQLHRLARAAPGWEPADALEPEVTYYHADRRQWVRITTQGLLAIAGGDLEYPRTYDLSSMNSIEERLGEVLETAAA